MPWKNTIRDPIIVGVSILAIGAAAVWLGSPLLAAIKLAAAEAWAFLISPFPIPGWLFCVLAALALAFTAGCLWRVREAIREPEYARYTEDTFKGVLWRWEYDKQKAIVNMAPYCAQDDAHLADWPDEQWGLTNLRCVMCEYSLRVEGTLQDLESIVKKQIDQKIRSGDWRSVSASVRRRPGDKTP